MRKILLASTALVAVAGISAASAEISLSGNTAWGYNSWSDNVADTATEGENNNKFLADTDIGAAWSTTTDSELSMSPDQRRSKRQTDVSAELGFNHTHIPCPPGYPHKPDNPHTKACVLQFFWSAIHDLSLIHI